MKAMVIREFGGPEVFEAREVPKPKPEGDELLVKVHATSVNPVDYKIRKRGSWAGVKPPAILGYDVSGVVESAGPLARGFKPGDEVFYTPLVLGGWQGANAEYHVATERIVARKPKNLNFTEAAAIPLAGCTSWDALVTRGAVRPGETVLIHAAAGGCGVFAVQIAKAAGCRVIGTCRASNADLVRSLGADEVIDYKSEDFVAAVARLTDRKGADFIFDTVGSDTLTRSIQAAAEQARIVSIVNVDGNIKGAYIKNITLHFMFMERAAHKMESLRLLAERGQLKPVIDSVMPLSEVAEAHRRLEVGGVRGKVVLTVP